VLVRLTDGLGARGLRRLRVAEGGDAVPAAGLDFAEAAAALRATLRNLGSDVPTEAKETIEAMIKGFDALVLCSRAGDPELRLRTLAELDGPR